MSILYGFKENWQMALLALELYWQYGVQLFSIPIISVIKDLYTILQYYERKEIVSLRKGTILPRVVSLFLEIELGLDMV